MCMSRCSVEHAINPAAVPPGAAAGWSGSSSCCSRRSLGGSQTRLQASDAARWPDIRGGMCWRRLCRWRSGPHISRGVYRMLGRHCAPALPRHSGRRCQASTLWRRLPSCSQQLHCCKQQGAGCEAHAAQRALVLAGWRLHIQVGAAQRACELAAAAAALLLQPGQQAGGVHAVRAGQLLAGLQGSGSGEGAAGSLRGWQCI